MSAALPILILGGGVGGLAQAALVAASTEATLVGIVEGEEVARARAEGLGHTVFTTLEEAPQDVRAAILALPAAHHAGAAEACAGRGWPMLIDKPIAAALRAGKRVAAAAERAGVPLLVGHHRRHHACVAAAREAARGGILGRLVAAQATWALRPPSRPGGFALRVESGGGPLLAHLIHDVDLLRHLIGETAEVSALASHAQRRGILDGVAAVALRFDGGALGTAILSDAGLSPWGWEAATGEADDILPTGEDCLRLIGTEGSMSLPSLAFWRHDGAGPGDAGRPLTRFELPCPRTRPLEAQLAHFVAVARDGTPPISDGADALRSLAATLAIAQSARDGAAARPDADALNAWELSAEALSPLVSGATGANDSQEGRAT